MSFADFTKDRQLPSKPNEIKLYHKKEIKDMQQYIKQHKLDPKTAKSITKQLTYLQEADLAAPEEDFDVQSLKAHKVETKHDAEIREFLKKSEELNSDAEVYRKTQMRSGKEAEALKIDSILCDNRRKQVKVAADGSCLFSAVGLAFPGRNMRSEMLSFIQSDSEAYETILSFGAEKLPEYLERMERDWGDELEISILAKMLSCKIVVWSRNGKIEYGAGGRTVEIVHIQFGPGGMGHYNGVIEW